MTSKAARLAKQFIAIAADAQRAENVDVGIQLERQAQQLDTRPIERSVRLDPVAQLRQQDIFTHRMRDQPGGVRRARVGGVNAPRLSAPNCGL